MQRLPEERTPTSDTPTAALPDEGSQFAALGDGILLALGLLWLAATMWTAHSSIIGNSANAAVALGSAAGALPGVIAASLLAGATAGLAASGRFAASATAVRRLIVGTAGGAVCGLLAAGAVRFGYGTNSSITLLAITVGIAAVFGGAAAALPRSVFAAGLVATFVVFVVGIVFNLLQPRLTSLFATDSTLSAQASASTLFAYTQSAVSGILAGLAGYWYLRRNDERPWPWYLLAGATPGLLLLLTEALTHLGGSSLLRIVRDLSDGDRALIDFTDYARLRNALVVIFVGGISAMIAVGRTLNRSDPEPDPK